MFPITLLQIFFALIPNLKEDKVSLEFTKEGLHVMMRVVKEFPPKHSYKSLVNLESLKGT